MDMSAKSSHTKRFVIEDSYTKVTADGEPHEMMTLVAGLSGVVAAIIILIVLVSLVSCKKDKRPRNCKNCPADTQSVNCIQNRSLHKPHRDNSIISRSSISTIQSRVTSIPETIEECVDLELQSDFELIDGNKNGNFNPTFESNEPNLTECLAKPKKRTHWQDEIEASTSAAKETVIDMPQR